MRLMTKFWRVLAAAVLMHGAVWAASFTAALDRDSITLGEPVTLSLVFEGGTARNVPTPQVAGLQFAQTGNSQNFSYINGAMSSTVTVTFTVNAQRAGEFTIPALTAEVGGQRLSTAPLKLIVSKAAAPSAAAVSSGQEAAFLKAVFPKNKAYVYVGEPVVAQLELYLRDDVQNFGNFQLNSAVTDGFSPGKTTELQGQRRRVQIGNRIYTIIPLALPLTAVRTGPLTLGPFTGSVVVVLPGGNQGNDPFRQFFNQGEQRQVMLATEPVGVESRALPAQNRPANFTGAIGSFTMNASAGPTELTVGDPITVHVQISGRGAFDGLTLPPQEAWRDFKTFPPTTKLETADQFGFQGTKTFEQIVSPLNADVHELPALAFSFFNPEDGQYHTMTAPAVPLVIKAAGASPPVAVAKNAATENQPPQDILPIKEKLDALAPATPPLVARPWFLAAQAVPVLTFMAAFVWRRRVENLANNPRLRRQRAVAQLVRDGLVDLKKHAAANESDDFFALLFRLLQEQLGERLDCPAGAITENVIEEHAGLRSAPQATLEALRELFQLCNQARYAPVRGSSELNLVAEKFAQALAGLQEVKA